MTTTTSALGATSEIGDHGSYVDWPAIIAGVVLASAISLLLLTFGTAVGFSFENFQTGDYGNPVFLGIAAALWLLWVQISSFMAGGYLTGRLRHRYPNTTEHEVDVRDGAHGLLVWAGALVIGAIIVSGEIGAAANAVGGAVSTATVAASNAADGAVPTDPNAYFVDTLFRNDAPATAGTAAMPVGGTGNAANSDYRAETSRILLNAGTGEVSDTDKTYLATLVARNTGLDQAQAEERVNTVLAQVEDAKAKAAAAAETARKVTVIGAFVTAASLLLSAAGAYWAASMGGRHRDEGTVFATIFRRY